MSTDTSLAVRSQEENWLPVLELAIEEVFEIMVGSRVKPVGKTDAPPPGGFTAMVGIAGGLCGILTVTCNKKTAGEIAKAMLGPEIADSEEQISDALGEICNMIAGNFESGSAQMKATSQATFDRIANLLRNRDCYIRVEGHTDNIPIHNSQFSSNWVLSVSRATEVVRLLIVRDGYVPDHLSAAGYAEFHPIASNATAEGRSLNRRVDIVILRQGAPAPATEAATSAKTPALTRPHATNSSPLAPLTATQSEKPSPTIGPKPLPVSGNSTPR
jgi:outer membrane protein OmpA-like peptidoglycan-associated protein